MSTGIHYSNTETDRLEMLLGALPIGIVVIDCKTRTIIDLNPQALVYFDRPLDQLVGEICTDHICPSEVGQCPILDKGQALDRSEREIITGDGSRMPVLKTVIEVSFDDRPVLLECIIDIRDRVLAQEELIKREKLQTVLEMAGAICHEFNQPLQIILGFCELMQGEILKLSEFSKQGKDMADRLNGNIDKIFKEIYRMKDLTWNLSKVTKYETKSYLNSKIIDIERSLEEF